MKKAVRTLRTRVARVHREVQRQLHLLPEAAKAKVQDLLQRTGRILTQGTKDKNKLYALHAPEVECISKGKARTPYESGVKVSIATPLKEGLVVGMRAMPGNPYDGHTLAETLAPVGILTGTDRGPATAIVDKGYRGVEIEGVRILRSGQRRGIPETVDERRYQTGDFGSRWTSGSQIEIGEGICGTAGRSTNAGLPSTVLSAAES